MSGLAGILKGISGELEAGRVLWVSGTALFVVSFISFAGIALLVKGQAFSPVEYGTGFAAGFGAALAAGGFGISQKDRGVARAVATTDATSSPQMGEK